MEVVFLRSFIQDIKKLNDAKLKNKIKDFIIELENVESIDKIEHVKKLKGYSTAYRWRVGNYRLGFYTDGQTVELARFVKRNDIYKPFP